MGVLDFVAEVLGALSAIGARELVGVLFGVFVVAVALGLMYLVGPKVGFGALLAGGIVWSLLR